MTFRKTMSGCKRITSLQDIYMTNETHFDLEAAIIVCNLNRSCWAKRRKSASTTEEEAKTKGGTG